MKNLRELILFVNKNKTKHIDNLLLSSRNSKTLELYHAIAENRFKSEKAAEEYFFPESKHKHEYFNRLKRNLSDQLSNLILLVDFSQSPYENKVKGYNYCAKNTAIINIWNYTIRKTNHVIKLAEKTYKVAEFHGFSDQCFLAARFCYLHYSNIDKQKKAQYYSAKADKAYTIIGYELKVEQYYTNLIKKGLKTQKVRTKEQNQKLLKQAKEVSQWQKKYPSNRINNLGFLFIIRSYEYLYEYEKVVKYCANLIEDHERNPAKYSSALINLAYLFSASLQIKIANFEEAQIFFEKGYPRFTKGNRNWFSFSFYFCIYTIHIKDYEEAYNSYKEIFSNPNFKKLPEAVLERWYVIEAYIYYLIKTKQINRESEKISFSINKFLNKVPKQRRDSGGYGISIWIIDIIHRLIDKNYNYLIDREDALKVYLNRYLKNDHTFRMACFLKMLITVTKSNFHPVLSEAKVKSKGLLKKLNSLPFTEAKQAEDIEIIPFERLWEIVVENL